uniref:Uncharacterized protein n=1 Tax=Solanum lycopersicum TaxID=4081 RepID=A0A3Q7FVN7_SOLLC
MTAYQNSIDESWKLCSIYLYFYLAVFMLWDDICGQLLLRKHSRIELPNLIWPGDKCRLWLVERQECRS